MYSNKDFLLILRVLRVLQLLLQYVANFDKKCYVFFVSSIMNCCRILVTVHNDKVQEIWQVYEPIFRILISIGLQGNLQFKSVIKAFVACFSTLDLDLDSARIQLDTLGYTPMPSVSVKSCHLCFLPGEPHLS